ncbi:hypothetical protein VOLCADRAFT_98199 [Volvox carteri f. nagariensis]|uniref:Uncharacterized protein n=1 Tax=Volvox carteri f. nagariensis TaxID=3068 RepID=D8UEQ2_VOLCA|nr:uncharacterized protein VOLCADRAFT_98199 [Volvox carteri f. nagariensis]EFJ41808.1 hypothetical protein VOLCADRAFT_98199 [Volvox carteri f. nagariensis]|eukprot:XP_002957154.1 hypothetical protein VOLCADRAFT_98199 [Volvox carteri f. nagariensis]
MGQSKSKHVYAFQPLPWPEALTAFRLVDQICGIASTYATTHLDKHATVVLDKVNELQRLPYLWDAFESDIERLRGTHMVRLATELHNALDKLEGCKYDMGLLAEKDLTFKSRRQAAEKALSLLREVEEAHRAFHYAFELALYGSLQRERTEAVEFHAPLQGTLGEGEAPDSPTLVTARGAEYGSSGGGAAAAAAGLRRALKEASAADLAAPAPLGLSPPPPPPAPEESWLQDTRSPSADRAATVRQSLVDAGELVPASPRRTPPAAAAPRPASPRPASPPPPQLTRRPMTADASTMARRVEQSAAPPPLQRPRSARRPSSSRSHSGRRGHETDRRGRVSETTGQQYVVMYMPQGPNGSGPRAILVPANALQPAPNSPGPAATSTAATTVIGGVSPFETNARAVYAAMPAVTAAPLSPQAAAGWGGGPYMSAALPIQPLPQLLSQPLLQQQQQQQAVKYSHPPPLPSAMGPLPPPSPPLVPYRSPTVDGKLPYSGAGAAPTSTYLTQNYSGGSAGSYSLPYTSSAHAHRSGSYRYFTPSPVTTQSPAPASMAPLHTAPASVYGHPSSPLYDMYGMYGTGLNHARRSTLSPALSLTASGTPNLNAYFDRPALSGGGSSGGFVSPLAAPPALLSGGGAATAGGASEGAAHGFSPARVRFVGRGAGGSGGSGGGGGRHGYDGAYESVGERDYGNAEADPEGGDFARGSSGTDRSHHTYTYGPQGSHAVPPYLKPYGSGRGMDLPDMYDPARRYSGGGGGSGRDRSGGNALELVSHFRGPSWVDDYEEYDGPDWPAAAVAPRRRRSSSYTPTAATRLSSPPLMAMTSRETEVDGIPLTTAAAAAAARRRRSSPPRPSSARTMPLLSYERMAALAGLDSELLGGGAAAALAASPSPPRRTSPPPAMVAAAAAQPPLQRPSSHLVPGESLLQRAEQLAAAVDAGDWSAAVDLGGLVRGGWWGDSRDVAVARGLLLQAALRGGSVEAHAMLGLMAERGEGLPGSRPDLTAAVRHYGAAAAGGHRDATTSLAYLLEHGLGVEQDESRAVQLYAAAAQRNCPTAANNLAKMILDGRGATAAATAAAAAAAGAEGTEGTSPASLAQTLFRRAARGGSASAWYNLGVCHLQQLKMKVKGASGDAVAAAAAAAPLAAAAREDLESEALRCFAEAAKRGHARAALRAGYLHLQRSTAAAALAERQAAILEVRTAAEAPPGTAAAAGVASNSSPEQPQSRPVGDASGGLGAAGAPPAVLRRRLSSTRSDRDGGDGDAADGLEDEIASERAGDGADGGSVDGVAIRRDAVDEDASSTRTGGTVSRAVGQLLATLAGSSNLYGADGGVVTAAAAAVAAAGDGLEDHPDATAAVRFAREICRLDFSCCRRPTADQPFTAPPPLADGVGGSGRVAIRGLRRLRYQAREVLAEGAATATAAANVSVPTPGSVSETSSVIGTAGAAAAPMVAALARLDLELQQPAERARRARRAAAELAAAAATLGHAAAQHWLAGWRWSMGQQAAAVALWEAAGRRGHGASLMVLGQMAESGQLPAEASGGGGGGGGADLAAAARYYLRAQEAGAPGAVDAMRRVQKLLQRHVNLQGKLEAVAAGGRGSSTAAAAAAAALAAAAASTTTRTAMTGGGRGALGCRPNV